jgi:hypothetical protein
MPPIFSRCPTTRGTHELTLVVVIEVVRDMVVLAERVVQIDQ